MVSQRKSVFLLVIGTCLAIVGIIFVISFPYILKYLLKKEISLVNGTIGFNAWKDIPFPIYQRIYFFNITNSDRFMRRREKPQLKEIGPYTFRSKWTKKAISWHPNGTVSYKEVKTFVFIRNESVGSQNDQLVTLNAPMLMAANFLKNYDLPIRLAASFAFGIAGERLIVKKSIKQLAFDGYKDIIVLLSPIVKRDIPFKEGLFAWLYGRNDTDDGLYNVFTGEDGLDKLNIIDKWNGDSSLRFWKGKTCNMLNGTNAEMGPPITPSQKTYSFFQSIFCRSITLERSSEDYHKGVYGIRFTATNKTFANGTINPDNSCFATANVLPSGVQDISKCQYGAPVILSFPHFYFADPWYLKMVDGMHPNATLHSFNLDVEPNSGVSINAAVRFQINMLLQKIPGIAQLQGIPKVVFPVFWAELVFTLTDDFAALFQHRILLPIFYAHVGIGSCLAIGCLLAFSAIVFLLHARWKVDKVHNSDEYEPLLSDNE